VVVVVVVVAVVAVVAILLPPPPTIDDLRDVNTPEEDGLAFPLASSEGRRSDVVSTPRPPPPTSR
jgi:hypothetical protein